jgi:acyl-CoA synthetase (AMP-forming)/AMP-acid ligase II
VVTIDLEGFVQIVDRAKDVIKSGGEWISSQDLENAIMSHPKVLEAAVIALPHPKWQERPLACVVPKPDFKDSLTKDEIFEHLKSRFTKMYMPDDVVSSRRAKDHVGKSIRRFTSAVQRFQTTRIIFNTSRFAYAYGAGKSARFILLYTIPIKMLFSIYTKE